MRIEDLAAARKRFVPYLHEAGYEDAVKDMGFAEAVAVLAGAIEYMESGKPTEAGFGDEYAAAVRAARTEVAYKALMARKLWYVRDKATRSPMYDSLGMFWVFSNEDCAKAGAGHLRELRDGLEVAVTDDARGFLERAVKYQGTAGFVIDNGAFPVFLRADEVASGAPGRGAPLARPDVANPELVSALVQGWQLSRARKKMESARHMTRAAMALLKATFIVPVLELEDTVAIPSVNMDGRALTPVFTDVEEFRAGVPGDAWTDGTCLDANGCLALGKDGIILNPGSVAWRCPAEALRKMLKDAERASRKSEQPKA